jgi:hypothetical protein
MGVPGAILLAAFLRRCPALTKLDVSGNWLRAGIT